MVAAMLATVSACDGSSGDPGFDEGSEPGGGKADGLDALGPGQLQITLAQEVSTDGFEVWWHPVRGDSQRLPLGEVIDVELSAGDCVEVVTRNPAYEIDPTIPDTEATIASHTCDFDLQPYVLNQVVLPVLSLRIGDYALVDVGPTSWEFGLEDVGLPGLYHTILPDTPYVLAPAVYQLKLGGRDNGGLYIAPEDWSAGEIDLHPGDALEVTMPAYDVRVHLTVDVDTSVEGDIALSTSGCYLGNWLTAERGTESYAQEFLQLMSGDPELLLFPSSEVRYEARISGLPVETVLSPGMSSSIQTYPHVVPHGEPEYEGGMEPYGEFTIERLDDGAAVMCDGPDAEGLSAIERSIFYTGSVLHLPEGRYAQVVAYEGEEPEYSEFTLP